jgi:hypothetical protein
MRRSIVVLVFCWTRWTSATASTDSAEALELKKRSRLTSAAAFDA